VTGELAKEEILDRLRNCVVNLDIQGVQKACKDALAAGIDAYDAITRGLARGMDIVGQKYEQGEYFLAELMMAGEAMKEGTKILEPYLKPETIGVAGRVVLGTVKGDLHDIGKNIVATLLKTAGFDVLDLGVDVPVHAFVEAVIKHKADILGMSALLTTTMMEMGSVIEETRRTGLRNKLKIIIGGASVTPEFAKRIGADAAATDAVKGVSVCKMWMSES
jgi:corrinoid protein of di/trimethylamine methyltransferase